MKFVVLNLLVVMFHSSVVSFAMSGAEPSQKSHMQEAKDSAIKAGDKITEAGKAAKDSAVSAAHAGHDKAIEVGHDIKKAGKKAGEQIKNTAQKVRKVIKKSLKRTADQL